MYYSFLKQHWVGQARFSLSCQYSSFYIYIYWLHFVCKPLNHSLYIYRPYTPNPSLAYVYIDVIYKFKAFIWPL